MGQRLGSLIGAGAGLGFVLLHVGELGSPLSVVLWIVSLVLFAATVWYAVIRTRNQPSAPPAPVDMRIYRICVAAEIVAIPVGIQVLTRVFDRPDLTSIWVVFVVGAHFLPFARAFHLPMFLGLGATLIVVAVVGGIVTVVVSPLGRPWTGVVAGLVLLGFAASGAYRRNTAATHPRSLQHTQ